MKAPVRRTPPAPTQRVLMICYYFPPLGGVGSLRAVKFAGYLPEFGWSPVVLAPSTGAYYRDSTLEFPEEKIVRSYSLELSRLGKRFLSRSTGDTKPLSVVGLRRRLRDWLRHALYRPDGQRGWYPFAVHAGRRLLRQTRFDAIFSSSYPVTGHLIARALHRETRLPWIAEFRDPYADELAHDDPRYRGASRLEQSILTTASAIVAPSPSWAELLGAKCQREVNVITNGCDSRDFPDVVDPERFVLSHLGSFMPKRQELGSVLRALAKLRNSELAGATLRLIGDPPPGVIDQIHEAGLEKAVEVTGFVPQRVALERLWSSTALLLAGPRDSDLLSRGWIPAKTFEYLATGLPIVYVGSVDNDAARLLATKEQCHLVPPGQDDAARLALLAASRESRVPRSPRGLSRREGAQSLAQLLDAIVKSRDSSRRIGASQ